MSFVNADFLFRFGQSLAIFEFANKSGQWTAKGNVKDEVPQQTLTFGDILFQSINEGLGKILDEQAIRAVNFYVDRHMALKDPQEYANSLNRMFQNESKRLVDEICDVLTSRFALHKGNWSNFAECVSQAREKYQSGV